MVIFDHDRDLHLLLVVCSAQSLQVAYNGTALVSDTVYTWQVRYYDLSGLASPWSESYVFSTGLFGDADWAGAQVYLHN